MGPQFGLGSLAGSSASLGGAPSVMQLAGGLWGPVAWLCLVGDWLSAMRVTGLALVRSHGDSCWVPSVQVLFKSLPAHVCCFPIDQSQSHGQAQSHCGRRL